MNTDPDGPSIIWSMGYYEISKVYKLQSNLSKKWTPKNRIALKNCKQFEQNCFLNVKELILKT